jgi:DNA-binding beta-propeller fold protein YncE
MNSKKLLSGAALVAVLAAAWFAWHGSHQSRQAAVVHAQTDNWTTPTAQKMGIRLLETHDAGGQPAFPVAAGDLLFFTNSGTSSGSKNVTNSVVVINARTKKPIAISALKSAFADDYTSHGIGLSADAKYIYLPTIASITGPEGKVPNATLVLDARTLKLHQVIASGGPPHHVKLFRDSHGKSRVLVEDWTWSTPTMNGKGIYELDPANDNKVLAGLLPGEAHGAMYNTFSTPDGKYFYTSMPAPHVGELRSVVDGWLAKIDIDTWKLVQSIPTKPYPLWTVFSKDGKWAWVTESGVDSVLRIQRGIGPKGKDKPAGEAKVGSGPYGMRLSIDDKELWVADKGEFRPKSSGTITVIDTETNTVKDTLKVDCFSNDHIILSPDGQEMWATCNHSMEVVVLDAKTHAIKSRIPMPNLGDSHGGVFVAYSAAPGGVKAEVVSDQNGLQGSALDAYLKETPWVMEGTR